MKNETKLYFLFHPQKTLLTATQSNESHVATQDWTVACRLGSDLLLFQSVCDLELLLLDASLSSIEIIERPFRWSTSAIQDNVSGFPPLLRWQRWQPCLRCLSTYTHSKSSLCPHLPHLKAYQRRRKWDFHYKEVSSWSYRSKSYSNRRCQTSFWT